MYMQTFEVLREFPGPDRFYFLVLSISMVSPAFVFFFVVFVMCVSCCLRAQVSCFRTSKQARQ